MSMAITRGLCFLWINDLTHHNGLLGAAGAWGGWFDSERRGCTSRAPRARVRSGVLASFYGRLKRRAMVWGDVALVRASSLVTAPWSCSHRGEGKFGDGC